MAGMLDDIDLKTQMAGQNRLEMLMFRLHGQQLFGINVFKVSVDRVAWIKSGNSRSCQPAWNQHPGDGSLTCRGWTQNG